MPRGVRVGEKEFGMGGAGWLVRRSGLGSACFGSIGRRGCRGRGFAEIAGPFFGVVFEWGDRRAPGVDGWHSVLHLWAWFWVGHLYAAQEFAGASLDARDFGADLRDLQDLSGDAGEIHFAVVGVYCGHYFALFWAAAAHGG